MSDKGAVKKGISLKPEQVKRIEETIDVSRFGAFSQFIQDAIDEKLARLPKPTNTIKKAS